jgi:hypothetical protein
VPFCSEFVFLTINSNKNMSFTSMMNLQKLILTALILVSAPAVTLAHGLHMAFSINPQNNYQMTSGVYYGFTIDPVGQDDSVFEPGSYTVSSVTTDSFQYTAAFAAVDPPNGIALGSTWGFDIVGPLLYWEPVGGFSDATVAATIVRSGNAFVVDKDSTFVAGGNLASGGGYNGNLGFHNSATVNLPLSAPNGLYAVGFQVRSTGATPYGTSDVFYAIGTLGMTAEEFNRGVEAYAAIGVPEPSTWALMGFGVVGLLTVARRRTRRAG